MVRNLTPFLEFFTEQLVGTIAMPATLIPRGRIQVSEGDGDPSSTKMPAKIVPRGRIHVSPAADQQLARRGTIPGGRIEVSPAADQRRGTIPGGNGAPPTRAWRAHWRTFKVNSHLEATDKITQQEQHESEIDLLSGLAEETAGSHGDCAWFCLHDGKEGKLRMREERKKHAGLDCT
jgi:hypothetical protein